MVEFGLELPELDIIACLDTQDGPAEDKQLADDAEIKDDFMLDPGNAFNTTLKGMGDFFRVFGVMLAAAAPILILIAVVIVVVLVIVHVVRKANAKKANARTEIK